jgi:CRP-like cAMP-binding protein
MALERDIDRLAAQPLLGLMPREALRLLAFAAEARMVRAGDVLFRRNQASDGAFLVAAGRIALDERDDGSPTDIVVGPGALIGEMALFVEGPRPATAVVRENGSVLKLPRTLMLRVLGEFPEAAAALHRAISARVAGLSDEIEDVRLRYLDAGPN